MDLSTSVTQLVETFLYVMLVIVGTWTSTSMSHTLHEASIVEMHKQWMTQHSRVYADNTEKERRFMIFKDNVAFVQNFNNETNRTYKLGINRFSDLTNEEFLSYYTGANTPTPNMLPSDNKPFRYQNSTHIPASLDWREKGAVTHIKNQHDCACCWAFATVAAIEGITKIKTGHLISLSEQQLVDCARTNNTEGCLGGYLHDAFEYIKQNKGINKETEYKYKGKDGKCDKVKVKNHAAQITGYENVPRNDEDALLKAVTAQPVSTYIDSRGKDFQLYSSGVFTGKCGTNEDHVVTIIGYGTTEDGIKYWLVKNSWGKSWGEMGYMRIQRGSHGPKGLCGIAKYPSYPIV